MHQQLSSSAIRDNHQRSSVGDFLTGKIQPGSLLSVVSACFTIYAYDSLKGFLDRIEHLAIIEKEGKVSTFPSSHEPRPHHPHAGPV